jgi:NAD(P)-dependent dehydrogenase (short-subunit alcohol dehydrogenase family)
MRPTSDSEEGVMSERYALVTGASTGMGRATALRLAGDGYRVFAGVRKEADGEALARDAAGNDGSTSGGFGGVVPVLLDVTDAGQIAAAARTVTARVGEAGLAALVNNAGVGVFGPLELASLEAIRWQFEVNVTGQVAVTQAFLPLLRAARGRIVMIGSIGDRAAMPFGEPLGASKAAIALMADALRQELAPWDVKVILIRPASIRTEAVDKFEADAEKAIASFTDEGRALYAGTYRRMVTAALPRLRRGSSPDVVANTVAAALAAPRPRTRYLAGKDSRRLATLSAVLPDRAFDAIRRRLFDLPAPGSLARESGQKAEGATGAAIR